MPALVGYQPTLSSKVAELENRISSSARLYITSVQAVYVPADDMTGPRRHDHRESSGYPSVILSRNLAATGIYPAVDPLLSGSRSMDRGTLGGRHYTIAGRCGAPRPLSGTGRSSRCLAWMNSVRPIASRLNVRASLQRYMTQPFMVTATHIQAWLSLGALETTLNDLKGFCEGLRRTG